MLRRRLFASVAAVEVTRGYFAVGSEGRPTRRGLAAARGGERVPPFARVTRPVTASDGGRVGAPCAQEVNATSIDGTAVMGGRSELEPLALAPLALDEWLSGRTAEAPRENAAVGPAVKVGVAANRDGLLRRSPMLRMAPLPGPSLETRIEDIVKVEENLAAATLPNVVKLLVDPQAEGVENVSLVDFVAMQPKRQLIALGHKKAWHDWLLASTHYKQVARVMLESPAYDLKALRHSGITNLYQWAEQPHLVRVSAYTRNLLDAAVEKSVRVHVEEVARVVNESNSVAGLLARWVSDVVGRLILDALHITPRDIAGTDAAAESNGLQPGTACTLDHYVRFIRKVYGGVRQDYITRNGPFDAATAGGGVSQGYFATPSLFGSPAAGAAASGGASRVVLSEEAEEEIRQRTMGVVADAFRQQLSVETAMPPELLGLKRDGYLALDRVPGLLQCAASVLQLRSIPVRYFVFHSTAHMDSGAAAAAAGSNVLNVMDASESGGRTGINLSVSGLDIPSPQSLVTAAFLTGTEQLNVTLGEWKGRPMNCGIPLEDPLQYEYISILNRLQRHTMRVARTSLFDVVRNGAYWSSFNAPEVLGLDQLFGPAKIIEDRLASLLNGSNPDGASASGRPVHVVVGGRSSGKSALLERLTIRATPGTRTATIRYGGGSPTPFVKGLDDHPVAMPARFWFRVALSTCPYLIRTEELYSRAPRSVMWWGNAWNWSWEAYQRLVEHSASTAAAPLEPLAAVLVDDFDRVMESLVGGAVEAAVGSVASDSAATGSAGASAAWEGTGVAAGVGEKKKRAGGGDPEEDTAGGAAAPGSTDALVALGHAGGVLAAPHSPQAQMLAGDLLEKCLAKITTAVSQVHLVFTVSRIEEQFMTFVDAPCRRFHLPLLQGSGTQQRIRMLPLLSVLYALHLRSQLPTSGLLYEVTKCCPGLLGHALEFLWHRKALLPDRHLPVSRLMELSLPMRLASAAAGASSGSGTSSGHGSGRAVPAALALSGVDPSGIYAELPLRQHIVTHPKAARLRLVELLQRQLASPTGYLATVIDTTRADESNGLVASYNHTMSQVHPFALFAAFGSSGDLHDFREKRAVRVWVEIWSEYCAAVATFGTSLHRKRCALALLLNGALMLRTIGLASNDKAAAAAAAALGGDASVATPIYGFPLLCSDFRSAAGRAAAKAGEGGQNKPPATGVRQVNSEHVKKAVAAYKAFFANGEHSELPFRPNPGLNAGCDVVQFCSSTLSLYDLMTSPEELRDVTFHMAQALLGVLHCVEKGIIPAGRLRQVRYTTVVVLDSASGAGLSALSAAAATAHAQAVASGARSMAPTASASASPTGGDVFGGSAGGALSATVPYFLDFSAVFEDEVIDKLRSAQEVLSVSKDFRTLNDFLDELEYQHGVSVHHDTVASQEELKSLLTATFTQLIPDATTLPYFAAPVATFEDLLLDTMMMDDDEVDVVRGAEVDDANIARTTWQSSYAVGHGAGSTATAGPVAAPGLGSGTFGTRAAAEEECYADHEHQHESAELLDALLNDQLDNLPTVPPPSPAMPAGRSTGDVDLAGAALYGMGDGATPGGPAAVAAASVALNPHASSEDAMAWLHDIIATSSGGTPQGASGDARPLHIPSHPSTVSTGAGADEAVADEGSAAEEIEVEEAAEAGDDDEAVTDMDPEDDEDGDSDSSRSTGGGSGSTRTAATAVKSETAKSRASTSSKRSKAAPPSGNHPPPTVKSKSAKSSSRDRDTRKSRQRKSAASKRSKTSSRSSAAAAAVATAVAASPQGKASRSGRGGSRR